MNHNTYYIIISIGFNCTIFVLNTLNFAHTNNIFCQNDFKNILNNTDNHLIQKHTIITII